MGSLPEAEKAKAVKQKPGVDVAVDPVTGEVTPVDDYHSSRMSLAAQGLPQTVATVTAVERFIMGASRSLDDKAKQTQEVELANQFQTST